MLGPNSECTSGTVMTVMAPHLDGCSAVPHAINGITKVLAGTRQIMHAEEAPRVGCICRLGQLLPLLLLPGRVPDKVLGRNASELQQTSDSTRQRVDQLA